MKRQLLISLKIVLYCPELWDMKTFAYVFTSVCDMNCYTQRDLLRIGLKKQMKKKLELIWNCRLCNVLASYNITPKLFCNAI